MSAHDRSHLGISRNDIIPNNLLWLPRLLPLADQIHLCTILAIRILENIIIVVHRTLLSDDDLVLAKLNARFIVLAFAHFNL